MTAGLAPKQQTQHAMHDTELQLALALRRMGLLEEPSGQLRYTVIAWDLIRGTYVIAGWSHDYGEAEEELAEAEADPAYEDAQIWQRVDG